MPTYNWVCQACSSTSPSGTNCCAKCHCPAYISKVEAEGWNRGVRDPEHLAEIGRNEQSWVDEFVLSFKSSTGTENAITITYLVAFFSWAFDLCDLSENHSDVLWQACYSVLFLFVPLAVFVYKENEHESSTNYVFVFAFLMALDYIIDVLPF